MSRESLSASADENVSIDPVQFIREAEEAWQRRDPKAAIAPYTADAVLLYGAELTRTGDELRDWPRRWFEYATDLRITKTLRAYSNGCLASEWRSEYTHPESGKEMVERGAEFFFFRDNKVYRHHMFEHSWPAREGPLQDWTSDGRVDAGREAVGGD